MADMQKMIEEYRETHFGQFSQDDLQEILDLDHEEYAIIRNALEAGFMCGYKQSQSDLRKNNIEVDSLELAIKKAQCAARTLADVCFSFPHAKVYMKPDFLLGTYEQGEMMVNICIDYLSEAMSEIREIQLLQERA